MQLNVLLLITSLVLLDIGVDPIQSSQIVPASNAKEHEFPWLVKLLMESGTESNRRTSSCEGTLIELDLVLTAAHCLVDLDDTSKITVKAGQHNIKNNEKTAQTRIAIFFASYPFYNKHMSINDIALIKLESKFEETNAVKRLLLPESDFDENLYDFATVAGWGMSDDGNDGNLKKVEVPMVKHDKCKESYIKSEDRIIVTSDQLCARKGGKDSCSRDFGGPFLCMYPSGWFSSTYEYIFCGIVSSGIGCGHADYPGVYTKVSSYLTWIERTKEIFPRKN